MVFDTLWNFRDVGLTVEPIDEALRRHDLLQELLSGYAPDAVDSEPLLAAMAEGCKKKKKKKPVKKAS